MTADSSFSRNESCFCITRKGYIFKFPFLLILPGNPDYKSKKCYKEELQALTGSHLEMTGTKRLRVAEPNSEGI